MRAAFVTDPVIHQRMCENLRNGSADGPCFPVQPVAERRRGGNLTPPHRVTLLITLRAGCWVAGLLLEKGLKAPVSEAHAFT